MRLRFTSWIPSLKPERIIATQWGCIQRRLAQKGVQWEQAKSIPIGYNEEYARIQMRIRKENPPRIIDEMRKAYELGDEERLIEPGDRAILTTDSKQSLKAVVACKVAKSALAVHEYIHFNTQGGIDQVCSNRLA